ncbi:rubredoxin-type fe 4 protein [Nannochloropsis gaditana CCMP526]|uniref:Rubredoxin domain protein n=1 Tax=Nannochloropsis gaditana TaxID=72520 RepID=W7TUX1_9STRA|nr:rubredoxin-type fe 4 protein [Nannochloropsis gaditana CCMP526]EKU22692.1 rubredoxin-type fe 4 protein [Nannochloropsis gaditana CCMP526]EWM24114.1 Rubredoxin domain protein [Nannochloropsis gaditana]|eukprot:XP_005853668.1 rubredoxin-type fe 4 protein [Nannochloropsis gaditana CCMP526]
MPSSTSRTILNVCLLLLVAFVSASAFFLPSSRVLSTGSNHALHKHVASRRPLPSYAASEEGVKDTELIGPTAPPAPAVVEKAEEDMTEEEKAMKAKMDKIKELKAKEVFQTQDTGDYECQVCGWQYKEEKGFGPYPAGTAFAALPADFKCPNCKAGKPAFKSMTKTIAGFSDNSKYGFGGNNLTSEQKGGLIFGGLFFFFVLFLSGYLLE